MRRFPRRQDRARTTARHEAVCSLRPRTRRRRRERARHIDCAPETGVRETASDPMAGVGTRWVPPGPVSTAIADTAHAPAVNAATRYQLAGSPPNSALA